MKRRADLLYKDWGEQGLVFATPERARNNSRIRNAISEATTWGEFRKMMPRADYADVIESAFDDNGEPRPTSNDSFSSVMVPGYVDGDYPDWLQQEMDDIMPEEVLERYGTREDSFLNGSFWQLPSNRLKVICAALERLGYKVESGEDLNFL